MICCFSNSAEIDNFNGDCMMQVELSFEGSKADIDKFVADNFPEWDKVSDFNQYTGPVSKFIDELYSVYDLNVCNESSLSICYEWFGFDDNWLQETYQKLTALGMAEIYLNYADMDGEFAGYVDFSTGVMVEDQFNGGDIDDVSEQLLGVLESWDTMSHWFDEDAEDTEKQKKKKKKKRKKKKCKNK